MRSITVNSSLAVRLVSIVTDRILTAARPSRLSCVVEATRLDAKVQRFTTFHRGLGGQDGN